jgi:formate-dependent nitrite reductase cytochrome c552 subunit
LHRDAFVDDAGGQIAWNQPQLLCAKCHGPVYRDWQAGSHGRANGYWDLSRGEQTRRKCIECHDPHSPPFQALKPAPGPNTLRMGAPFAPSHGGVRDPLRLQSAHDPGHSAPEL